jgi:hypothetical protein
MRISFCDPTEIQKLKNTSRLSTFLLFLFFFIISSTNFAIAQDFIAGTVLAVDINRMEIELVPGPPPQATGDETEMKSITARLTIDNLVVNRRGDRVFPGCVFPGGMIRIWGKMDEKERIFMVSDIRGYGGRGQTDPTGVRRRLQKMGPGYCPGGPGFRGGRQ